MIVVVMGVSGSGKSTIGTRLAARLGVPFVEGDAFHDPASIEAMSQGRPLTNTDRAPWLDRVNAALRAHDAAEGCVCACSALDQWARDRLGTGVAEVRFVWLHGDPELLAARLRKRTGHPIGPSLLASQLAALEPPTAPSTLAIDVAAQPDVIVERILDWLDRAGAPAPSPDVGPQDM